jgi:hypothetical protein
VIDPLSAEATAARVEHMEYKQFVINAFEPEPGNWRGRVRRKSGRPLRASSRTKMEAYITDVDSASASEAMAIAMAVIDEGKFSRETARSTEKFWRRRSSKRSTRSRSPSQST